MRHTDLFLEIFNHGPDPVALNVSLSNMERLQPSVMYSMRLYETGATVGQAHGRGGAGWGRSIIGIQVDGERFDAGPPPDDVYSLFYTLPEDDHHIFEVPTGRSHLLVALDHLEGTLRLRVDDAGAAASLSFGNASFDPLYRRFLFSNNDADWDDRNEVYSAWGGAFLGSDEETLRHEYNIVLVMPGNNAQGTISITDSGGRVCKNPPSTILVGLASRLPPGPTRIDANVLAPPWSPVHPLYVWTIITDIPLPAEEAGAPICFTE